jgi:SAM-dependent methyltransferase
MKVSTQDVGLKLGRILGQFLLKTDHLHYGLWTEGLEVKLDNLPQAQHNYADFLMENIPDDINSILDIGCGVGENASMLLDKGYKVDCVSPSHYLSQVTKEKVGDKSEIFESTFEEVQTDKKYDLMLFSESFQYIKIDQALDKCTEFLNDGGYILICDFFKIPGEGARPMGGGHKLKKFLDIMSKKPFTRVKDLDITDQAAPNIALVDSFLQQVVVPIYKIISEFLHCNYRFLSFIGSFIAKLFFNKKLKKLSYKYLSGERNEANFKKFKTYRLFIYKKNK